MRYEHQLQIGISHIGKDSRLKLGAAMDLLQNATWFQINTEKIPLPGDLILPRCTRSGDDAFTVTLSAGPPAGSSAEHSAEDGGLFTVMEFSGA